MARGGGDGPARRSPTQFEAEVRAVFRMAAVVIGVLVVAVLWLTHPSHGAQLAPCPPAECAFHPHAPHGPGPGSKP